jgi:transcriptional antiterminator NusG
MRSSFFRGSIHGYQGCNTWYHNFKHTTDCLLTMARLMHGASLKILLQLPLFPSYLFVHTHLDTSVFHQIIKVDGVMRLLGNGNPAPVPAEQVESIQTIVAGDRQYYPWRYLEKGKKVRVLDGPLAGVVGILVARKDKQRRLVVAVEMFQRSVTVELDCEAVERWS